jgi:hypothetical protein
MSGRASERRSTSQFAISLRDQFLRGRGRYLARFPHVIRYVDGQALEAGLTGLRAGVVDFAKAALMTLSPKLQNSVLAAGRLPKARP